MTEHPKYEVIALAGIDIEVRATYPRMENGPLTTHSFFFSPQEAKALMDILPKAIDVAKMERPIVCWELPIIATKGETVSIHTDKSNSSYQGGCAS